MDSVVGGTEREKRERKGEGERGKEGERERERGRGRESCLILAPIPAGTSLKTAGGESFEAAVKEISDKSLNLGEGTESIMRFPISFSPFWKILCKLNPSLFLFLTAAIGGSGDLLPCKHVIHVHSPSWPSTDAVENLEKAIKNCLTLAENKNLSTVAFPSVASGS